MKHYKLVEFLSNLNIKPNLHERKAPYWLLSGNGSDIGDPNVQTRGGNHLAPALEARSCTQNHWGGARHGYRWHLYHTENAPPHLGW